MNKGELKSYLFRNGWRDSKYIPDRYKDKSMLYKSWADAGKPESGVYEKEGITSKRIKLLKTSIRLEVRCIGGWKRVASVRYEDLEFVDGTGILYDKSKPKGL